MILTKNWHTFYVFFGFFLNLNFNNTFFSSFFLSFFFGFSLKFFLLINTCFSWNFRSSTTFWTFLLVVLESFFKSPFFQGCLFLSFWTFFSRFLDFITKQNSFLKPFSLVLNLNFHNKSSILFYFSQFSLVLAFRSNFFFSWTLAFLRISNFYFQFFSYWSFCSCFEKLFQILIFFSSFFPQFFDLFINEQNKFTKVFFLFLNLNFHHKSSIFFFLSFFSF